VHYPACRLNIPFGALVQKLACLCRVQEEVARQAKAKYSRHAQPQPSPQLPPLPNYLSSLPSLPQTLPYNQQFAAAPTGYSVLAGLPPQHLSHVTALKQETTYRAPASILQQSAAPLSGPYKTSTLGAQQNIGEAGYKSAAFPAANHNLGLTSSNIDMAASQHGLADSDSGRKRKAEEDHVAYAKQQHTATGAPQQQAIPQQVSILSPHHPWVVLFFSDKDKICKESQVPHLCC
jgi:hypothetical protein